MAKSVEPSPSSELAVDAFKNAFKRARRKTLLSANRKSLTVKASGVSGSHMLGVPGHERRRSNASLHSRSRGSSGGNSSGGSGDSERGRYHHHHKIKKDKRDNICTRFRDVIAEADVFIEQQNVPVCITCIRGSFICIPIFIITLIWDTLALTVFQMAKMSMINAAGFLLFFHFAVILVTMYGYSVQYVRKGAKNGYVKVAKYSLISHYLLFCWRVFMELYFDGYRPQENNYLPHKY